MTHATCPTDGSALASGIESCDPFGEDCGNGESDALVDKANNVAGADGAEAGDLRRFAFQRGVMVARRSQLGFPA